jgi:glycine/D-amino acid oxidase-like deaminating enzyme
MSLPASASARVIVIGGGITGASLAYHLAKAGCDPFASSQALYGGVWIAATGTSTPTSRLTRSPTPPARSACASPSARG